METNGYRVILLGIESGADPAEVKQRLAKSFQTPQDKIEQLLSKLPVVVKSQADYLTAVKYEAAIREAGCICRIEPVEETGAVPVPSPTDASSLKTCPNCGYTAVSPDDPLLTAHDGQGECPSCGIIVAKFSSRHSAEENTPEPPQLPEADEIVVPSPSKWDSIKHSVRSRPWTTLLIVVAIVGLIVQFAVRDSGKDTKAQADAGSAGAGQAGPDLTDQPAAVPASILRVLPGDRKQVVMTVYLDYLHRDTFSSMSFTPVVKVENTWEKFGVHVDIQNSRVTPVTLQLWEHQENSNDNYWAPSVYRDVATVGSSRRGIVSGVNLFTTPFVFEIVKDPGKSNAKFGEGNRDYRKNPYNVYRLDIMFSISVPSGMEFGARDLEPVTDANGNSYPAGARQGNFCVTTIVTWDNDSSAEALMGAAGRSGPWKAQKGASLNMKRNCIYMKQVTGEAGIYLEPQEKIPQFASYCELKMD